MTKILIFLFGIFQFGNSYSQEYSSPIDSTIASFHLTDSDWVVGLTIDQAGYIGIYDSLGNQLDEDPNGIYIISKINSQCKFYKLNGYFSIPGNWKTGSVLNIFDSSICSYTVDSIKKASNEWIYPNVYLNDSLKVYNVQMESPHSPSFQFCFRTKEMTQFKTFNEIDVFISPQLISFFHKNLNYNYNSSTFIFRAFMNIVNILRKETKIGLLL